MIFKRKSLPESYYEVLPEDFKKTKYNKVSETEYFGVRSGYSYEIQQEGKKLTLTKSGISETGNMGLGMFYQGLRKGRHGTESKTIELIHE